MVGERPSSTVNGADAAFEECLALLRSGQAEAGASVQQLLLRFPDHAAGWMLVGAELARLHKHEAALACFRRAFRVDPTAACALNCGRMLRRLGRTTDARAAFADACRLDPSSAPAHFLHGVSAQDDRDLSGAATAYRQALHRDANLAEAAVNLGTVLQEMGDLDGAKHAYRQAVRLRRDTFGRVAQALTASPRGELWLDLGRLRRDLAG